jgi:hypothetical protein
MSIGIVAYGGDYKSVIRKCPGSDLGNGKAKGRLHGAALLSDPNLLRLENLNVFCLEAFGAFYDIELDCLSFLQRTEAIRLNRGEMNEDIFARLTRDETKSLGIVKPLYCSLFHFVNPLFVLIEAE